jgi:ElaB/YqjD/DUF883 family membrane-anchored ribosome-binding protein
MGADAVVSRELRSLQDELLTSQRERVTAEPSTATPAGPTPAASASPAETAEEHELRQQLRELVNEVTTFFEEAEKDIAAHPTQSVVGALLVGVLIGRLLGRR